MNAPGLSQTKMLEWWFLIPSRLQGDSPHVWKLPTLQLEVGLMVGEAWAAGAASTPAQQAGLDHSCCGGEVMLQPSSDRWQTGIIMES